MLWIKNVELQSEGRRFTKLTSKYIRISYKNSVSLSKNENTYQNESTIKWDNANLTIPAVWDADVDFEVFDKHEFGYNPEELKTVLYGTFRVSKNQKDGKYPVLSSAENDKKVGFVLMDFTKPSPQTSITATTEKKEESPNKSIPSISLPKCAQVSSILLRKTKKPLGKIYLLMKSDEGKILSKTDPINPISGEYLLTNKYKIESLAPKQSLLFEVHDAATDELKGNGKIFYGSCSKSNKVDMLDESGNTLGELYFKL